MQQHRKMRKNYDLKSIGAHPGATYGGLLQIPSGSIQMNGLKRSASIKKLPPRQAAPPKPDNHNNRKINGTDFLSAEDRPGLHWFTLKTDQESRRRQVLVVHW
jgi:hypothetical protein